MTLKNFLVTLPPLSVQRNKTTPMQIKTFIEKAIEGGWNHKTEVSADFKTGREEKLIAQIQYEYQNGLFLCPEAWQAVGKVEGWGVNYCENYGEGRDIYLRGWKSKMLGMIHALWKGKTIEEYLKTL